MSNASSMTALIDDLITIVGHDGLLTTPRQQQVYIQGMVPGATAENVMAVIIPQTLIALWHVITQCAKHDVIIIAQAANTGLTGGSTPWGDYDRPVVIISMQQLAGIYLLNDGKEIIALPAATLQQLETEIAPLGREPHSVLGSSCVGASIIGGICNNSGGMLVQRGPAYTEMSLFAQRNATGEFELVNHLGISLGESPIEILSNLQSGQFDKNNLLQVADRVCTNHSYKDKVRECEEGTPARFNNDASGHFEASGSAGKLIVFAVRVATFAKSIDEQTFYVSTNDADSLTTLRQDWLKSDLELPVLAEYMHRDYNEVTLKYGRDTCLSMRKLPASKIAALYKWQAKIGFYLDKWHLPLSLPDRVLQVASVFMPASLPKPLATQSLNYDYHLIIKMADENIGLAQEFLQAHSQHVQCVIHTCSKEEADKLLVFRSAATAAMFRYHNLNCSDYGELISTDIALPRNALDWDEKLTENLQQQVKKTFYLGHFFCHVMHQDYLLQPFINTEAFKEELLEFYDQRHIEYPAEHNVGHIYQAKPQLKSFYKTLDPTNSLNPGIGQTAKWKNWRLSPFMEE